MQFCELSKEEYAIFQREHPYNNFLNGIEMMEMEALEGYETMLLGMKEKGHIACAAMVVRMPILKKFHYLYAPRGILIDYHDEALLKDFIKQIKQYAKKHKDVFFLCDPYVLYKERDNEGSLVEGGFDHSYVIEALEKCGLIHQGFPVGYGNVMQGIRFMYSLNVKGKTLDEIRRAFHQQVKRSLNKALKTPLKIEEVKYEELSFLADILSHTGERKHFEARALSFYEHQYQAFKNHLKVWKVSLDCDAYLMQLQNQIQAEETKLEELNQRKQEAVNDKILKKEKVCLENLSSAKKRYEETKKLKATYGNVIAMSAGVFLLYGKELTYLYGGNYEQFKQYHASYALQWHAIQEAHALGFEKYNFYGISGEFGEDSHDGVYQFKKSFAGQVEELVGDFILVCRPCIYKLYELRNK